MTRRWNQIYRLWITIIISLWTSSLYSHPIASNFCQPIWKSRIVQAIGFELAERKGERKRHSERRPSKKNNEELCIYLIYSHALLFAQRCAFEHLLSTRSGVFRFGLRVHTYALDWEYACSNATQTLYHQSINCGSTRYPRSRLFSPIENNSNKP